MSNTPTPITGTVLKWYLWLASFILLLTGAAKLAYALGEHDALPLQDPVFPLLTTRQILCAAAALEVVVAILVLRIRSATFALDILIWLSSIIILYRLV